MARVILPAATQGALDDNGLFSGPWRLFLAGLWQRTGSAQDITISATSNTSLVISYRGSDGVVRKATLTLS